MSKSYEIEASGRDTLGTSSARAVRNAGRVPAVVYGGDEPPEHIAVEERDLVKSIQRGNFLATLFQVKRDGSQTRCIPRDVQYHPVTDRPLHVDFLRLGEGARVNLMIPVNFLNEEKCPGLKRGGVLNVVRHEVELNCSVDAIPEALELDLGEAVIGDSLKISSITLPPDTQTIITDRDFTIATIAAPSGLSVDDEEGAADGEEADASDGGGEADSD
ncbi:MAG: 50S ribosomal protein L25/general stress protein Ctc [Pseudomonadota bacterium]